MHAVSLQREWSHLHSHCTTFIRTPTQCICQLEVVKLWHSVINTDYLPLNPVSCASSFVAFPRQLVDHDFNVAAESEGLFNWVWKPLRSKKGDGVFTRDLARWHCISAEDGSKL
jgi:hypothetical protein